MQHRFLLRLRQIGRLEDHELDKRVDEKANGKGHPPKADRSRQRLCDRLPAELDADQKLRHDNRQEDPGLLAELVAVGVVQELKGLPEAHGAPEKQEEEPETVEPVFRGELQDELQVERVQLCDQEHEDDAAHGQPPLQRRQGVPRKLDPSVGAIT